MKLRKLRAITLLGGFAVLALAAAACGSDTIVEVTRVVERTVIVEQPGAVVLETVIVEKEVKGDTVVVTATAGAVPIPTVEPERPAPAPKTAQGTLTFATIQILSAQGLNSTGGPPKNIFPVTEDLFVYDFDGDREALQLAESWNLASDLSYVDVTIQQGIPWQGGGLGDFGELTAADVAYSYNDANPAFNPVSITDGGGFWSNLIGNQEVVVLDDYVVRFPIAQFDVRWASFYLTDSGLGAQVISKSVLEQMGETWAKANPIGTGPYTVSEWEEGGKVILERVENHWRQTGEATSITFIHAPEEATRLAMMRTGEADAMEISVNQIASMQRNGMIAAGTGGGIQMGTFFSGNLWEIVHAGTGEDLPKAGTFVHDIQWIGNPFSPDDANNPDALACEGVGYPEILEVGKGCGDMEQARLVRKALAVAIDRDLIVETILGGIGNAVYVEYFDPKDPNWQDKWFVPYDPDLANALLDEAGFERGSNGQRFRMALYAGPELGGGLGISGEIADAVAGFWQELGIGVEVQKGAYAIFRPSVVGRTNTIPWLTSCGEGRDGNPWDWPKGVQMTSRSRGGFSCGFETPFAAEQYGKAAANPDKSERIRLMNETANYLFEQSLSPGVVSVPLSIVYNPNSIAEWPMRPDWRSGWNAPEYIKLAR